MVSGYAAQVVVLLLLSLACGGGDGDSGATSDGGVADGGDGAAAGDGGAPDGGAGDGGAGDGGAAGSCDALRWYEGDLSLSTQAALTPFCDSYNAVRGTLYVDVGAAEDPITELDGIGCLCEVTGDLTITGDSAAEPPGGPPPPHVTGDIELSVLERVGGDLVLTHHPGLSYVEGMRALREVGGDLRIAHNPEMQVASFYALERLGGTASITDMDKQLILRLPEATSVGGIVLGAPGDAGTLYFLVEVKLDSLAEITGDLRLYGPRNLGLLAAPALARVGGTVQVQGSCIADLSLPLLEEVGALRLEGNCGLLDLDGLAGLRRVLGQDIDGASLVVTGSEHLDAGELDAFLGQLEQAGTGAVQLDPAIPCDAVAATYAEGWCG